MVVLHLEPDWSAQSPKNIEQALKDQLALFLGGEVRESQWTSEVHWRSTCKDTHLSVPELQILSVIVEIIRLQVGEDRASGETQCQECADSTISNI